MKKHKLAKYSEEEMRGIFAKGTSLPPTPVETGPTGRFSAPPVEEELDKYTVTSSLSIFDYFASKKGMITCRHRFRTRVLLIIIIDLFSLIFR